MNKNLRNGFFLITSKLGKEHEQFISTVGNLCSETDVIAVNKIGIERPGILANSWNISKATFLITAESPEVVESILNKLTYFTGSDNIQTIKVDGLMKETDPIFNSEKHLFALKNDLTSLSGNFSTIINNFIENNTISYENVKYELKQIFFAFKDSLVVEFRNFKEIMYQECDNLRNEINYNVAEQRLKEIFHEYEIQINLKLIEYEDSIRSKFTNILNSNDEFKINLNQEFENFKQDLLNRFESFRLDAGITDTLNSMEENLNQIQNSVDNKFNNLSGYIIELEERINERLDEIEYNTDENLIHNENSFLRKNEFRGDGVVIINNGNFVKLDKPISPSVLTFDGNEFKWQPYKEYEI